MPLKSRLHSKQKKRETKNPVSPSLYQLPLKASITDFESHHRDFRMVRHIFTDTAQKEMGKPFTAMGRYTNGIGTIIFTVIQNTPFYGVVVINFDLYANIRFVKEFIDPLISVGGI